MTKPRKPRGRAPKKNVQKAEDGTMPAQDPTQDVAPDPMDAPTTPELETAGTTDAPATPEPETAGTTDAPTTPEPETAETTDAPATPEPETSETAGGADPVETQPEAQPSRDEGRPVDTGPDDDAFQTGADDGEDALSEAEQREIAEAALREAESGYKSGDRADRPDADARVEPEPVSSEADTGVAAAAATGAAAAATLAPTPAQPQKEIVIEKRGGFVPGLLGGVVAVAGALVAAPYVLPESMRPVMSLAPVETQLAAQTDEISGVAGSVGSLSGRMDAVEGTLADVNTALADTNTTLADTVRTDALDAMDARLAALQADLSGRTDELNARLDQLTDELVNLQRSPLDDSTDPAVISALAAYGREVQELREEVEAQTEENARVIEEAAEATAEARAAAEAEQQAAAERAAIAAGQQALVDIKSALDSGEPFAEALAKIDAEVPEALSAVAESGVSTLAALQATFSEPAREALDTARRSDVGDDPAERGMSFLQTQLGMRSLAPKEGDGADAVLSRAEAATRDGDVATAVSELQALPEPSIAVMQDWIARASARAEAVAAADALAQSLATN